MVELGQMTAVTGVLALLGLTLWFLRRCGVPGTRSARNGPARRLECVERLPLGPHHTLHLIRMGEASLLVASSPGGCSLVHSLPAEASARRTGDLR